MSSGPIPISYEGVKTLNDLYNYYQRIDVQLPPQLGYAVKMITLNNIQVVENDRPGYGGGNSKEEDYFTISNGTMTEIAYTYIPGDTSTAGKLLENAFESISFNTPN